MPAPPASSPRPPSDPLWIVRALSAANHQYLLEEVGLHFENMGQALNNTLVTNGHIFSFHWLERTASADRNLVHLNF